MMAANISMFSEDVKKDTVVKWKTGGTGSLTFNQVELTNWAKGGESSVSGTVFLNLFANFSEGNINWDNTADFGYGIQRQDEAKLRKNEDKIDLTSKLGYKATESLFYTALMSFKSQFYHGYNYPNDSVPVSQFFAPAFLVASLGLDWKPSEIFSLYLSPCSGRFIFVQNTAMADMGIFTGQPAKYDTGKVLIEHGKTYKHEFGAYLNAKLKIDILKNINLESKLSMFNNYTDKNTANRGNISLDWANNIIFKVNSFISANLFVQMIYDHDTKIPLYEKIGGVKTKVGEGSRLQVKEVFGLGLYYKF